MYHAACQWNSVNDPGKNSMLPLIIEKAHTIETQYHFTNTVAKTLSIVNPNQTPIDVCDQPMVISWIIWQLKVLFPVG